MFPSHATKDSFAPCGNSLLLNSKQSESNGIVTIFNYSDVIISAMASKITGVSVVYSNVCSGSDPGKNQELCITGLCEWNSPVTGPVTRSMFPFDNITMQQRQVCRYGDYHSDSSRCTPCGIGRGYYVLPSPKWRSLESRLDKFFWISSKEKRDYVKTTTHICSSMLEETTYQVSVSLVLWSLRN